MEATLRFGVEKTFVSLRTMFRRYSGPVENGSTVETRKLSGRYSGPVEYGGTMENAEANDQLDGKVTL